MQTSHIFHLVVVVIFFAFVVVVATIWYDFCL